MKYKQRKENVTKAFAKSSIDGVTSKFQRRQGYLEVRLYSDEVNALDDDMILNILKFAEPGAYGAYAKSFIVRSKGTQNGIRIKGAIAHLPV